MDNSNFRLPIGSWAESIISWIGIYFDGLFSLSKEIIKFGNSHFVNLLSSINPYVLIILIGIVAYVLTRKIGITIFSILGLILIYNMGYWGDTIKTTSLVLMSVLISLTIGIPLGILATQSRWVNKILTPIMDFMQTMPAFVYLIPSILFFGIGVMPGVVSTVIFAMPPTVRLTILGIQQVPQELIEASDAFGSTKMQKLLKLQLPLATGTIMAGINQSIMLALSMVVVAALVGAPGLGDPVVRAVQQIDISLGVEAGLSIVIVAMILDRITQNVKTSSR